MPKLERYHIDDFMAEDHTEKESSLSVPIFMINKEGQGAFDYLHITTYDNSAKKAARIGGMALLAGTRFHGHLSLIDHSGEITIRHRPS